MTDTVSLTIDGQEITVPVGTTILHAAQSIGEEIPTICYHEHCTPNALCRTCVVEVEGARVQEVRDVAADVVHQPPLLPQLHEQPRRHPFAQDYGDER